MLSALCHSGANCTYRSIHYCKQQIVLLSNTMVGNSPCCKSTKYSCTLCQRMVHNMAVLQADKRMGACHVGCDDIGLGILCPSRNGHQSFLPTVWQACSAGKANVIHMPTVGICCQLQAYLRWVPTCYLTEHSTSQLHCTMSQRSCQFSILYGYSGRLCIVSLETISMLLTSCMHVADLTPPSVEDSLNQCMKVCEII